MHRTGYVWLASHRLWLGMWLGALGLGGCIGDRERPTGADESAPAHSALPNSSTAGRVTADSAEAVPVPPNPGALSDSIIPIIPDRQTIFESDSSRLRVAMTDSGPLLVLPSAMYRALMEYAPDYRPWWLQEYDSAWADYVWRLEKERIPLFGAVGDFNGDGIYDVALQGRRDDYTRQYFFVIMSTGSSFRIEEIWKAWHAKRWGRRVHLALLRPGTGKAKEYFAIAEGPDATLAIDAFESVRGEDGSTIYYWKDGRLMSYSLGAGE